jgi:hypothetical protein
MKNFRSIIVLISVVFLYSCEAPRVNPLDPNNPDYQFSTIDGYVKTTSLPTKAISGAKVTWRNQNIVITTDANGYYKFPNVPKKDGLIVFEADGYYKDSTTVQVTSTQKHVDDFTLRDVTRIDGYVKTISLPSKPISGVKVTLKNQNIVVQTDATGYYKFTNIQMTNSIITFEADGYYKDSVNAQVSGQQTKKLDDFLMNAIPKLNNMFLYATVLNRYPDVQDTYLNVQAWITDTKNDIDSVFLSCSLINFNRKLVYNSSTKAYEGAYLPSDFSTLSIDGLIGRSFEIIVKVKNRSDAIGSSDIKRIIRQEAIPLSPSNKQLVGSSPTLVWQQFIPGFNFTYTIEIYKDTLSTSTLLWAWQKQNISEDAKQIVTDISIPPGEYYWVIWCIDDYQNRTRSKPASFVVH